MIATFRTTAISQKPPELSGYEWVNVHSWHPKTTQYFELCPYALKTDGNEENVCTPGVLFENFWQSCKVFRTVYDIEVYPHAQLRGNPAYLQWKYTCDKGKKTHLDENDNLTRDYFRWRKSIRACPCPIRYPNGYHRKTQTLFSYSRHRKGEKHLYSYLDAREKIYIKEYTRLVRNLPVYDTLLQKLRDGKNLLITEVDVPGPGKKGKSGEYIDEQGFYFATLSSLEELRADPSEPFGHGLCLAKALLDDLTK